jgi:hypothetical protein
MLSQTSDSFSISFEVECREGSIAFAWRGTITGHSTGGVEYTMSGVARSDFLRNRIGFCVLHPIPECAGRECHVETVDGHTVSGRFPRPISPHQPFQNIRAISHEVEPGQRVEVRMTGDVYEMEDQRNWSDASYKTYCTPLSLPYPVQVTAGTVVEQKIEVVLQPAPMSLAPALEPLSSTIVDVGTGPQCPLPHIGLSTSGSAGTLRASEASRLRRLGLQHLRVDLGLGQQGWREELSSAARDARAIGVGLEAALFLGPSPAAELEMVAREVEMLDAPVARWLVYRVGEGATASRWLETARNLLPARRGRVPVGFGAPGNFTDLNRSRPSGQMADVICYSANPQVHAFDDLSLVETLPIHLDIAATARSFVGNQPLAVTPLTLRPSPNPSHPERGEGGISGGTLPPSVDPRQMSLFCAAWTVGALKYLSQAGIASVTLFETKGWRGVMETQEGSPNPELFMSVPGAVFPVYHVLADVGEWIGAAALPTRSDNPLVVECLALQRNGQRRTLVANLTAREQHILVRGIGGPAELRILDEVCAEPAMREPELFRERQGQFCAGASRGATEPLSLKLRPYAIARIDASVHPHE